MRASALTVPGADANLLLLLGDRPVVGHVALDHGTGVRILFPQPHQNQSTTPHGLSRRYRLGVRTGGSQPSNRGSNPRSATIFSGAGSDSHRARAKGAPSMPSRRSTHHPLKAPAPRIAVLASCILSALATPSKAAPPRGGMWHASRQESPGKMPANVEWVESLGGISQYRLKSNGLTPLLKQNDAAPVITFEVVYHVGSRNEAPGNTGSAHLLEHLLFNKSTQNFGHARGHKTFQEVLYEAGCDYSSTNMTTWYDRMNGYSTLPADKLELAMRIE